MNVARLVDMHTHTDRSDGALSPEALVRLASQKHLAGIAITDHDEVDALQSAIDTGLSLGVKVIPGVELSATNNGFDVHILGYFVDHENPRLLRFLDYLKERRVSRIHQIVEKLNQIGLPLTFEAVTQQASGGCIGRPHVANALVQQGFVPCYQYAFDNYLAEDKVAFVPKVEIQPGEAIATIHQAGGLAGLAHPGQNLSAQSVLEVIDAGIDAIETIHPKHSPAKQQYFQTLARRYHLLETGGSDFHGGHRAVNKLGRFGVSYEDTRKLEEFAKWRNGQWH